MRLLLMFNTFPSRTVVLTVTALLAMMATSSAQATLYTDRPTFEAATSAVEVTIPPSSTFPNPLPWVLDFGCTSNLIGIDLPLVDPKLNVWAPASNGSICIVGPSTNLPLTNTNPHPTSPSIAGDGEDDFVVDFDPPAVAVGLTLITNSTAIHTITITYTDATTQVFSDTSLDTAPNAFEFVGFKSAKPIDKLFFDGNNGKIQNELIAGLLVESLPAACVRSPRGLVGWWPGDGTPFNRIGSDDGTLVNGAGFTTGKVGQAFSLDGVDDYVRIDSPTVLDRTGDMTVELWLRADQLPSAGNGAYVLADFDLGGNASQGSLSYGFGASHANVGYYHKHTDGTSLDLSFAGGPALVPGRWHHVAFSRDDTAKTVAVYVDGMLEATGSYAGKTIVPATETGTWTIGRAGDNSQGYAKAAVDELAVYERALSAEEIRSIFQAGRAGRCPDVTPPVANAGADRSIHAATTVLLDGSASFDDTTATANLAFSWTMLSRPATSSAALVAPDTATPSFVADAVGEYEVQLVVTDEAGNASVPAVVKISSRNLAPTADAGADQVVVVDTVAVLDGFGSSDPENDALSYRWTIVSAPCRSSALLVGANTATPSLTPDKTGSYTLQLIVDDGIAPSPPSTVTVAAILSARYAECRLREASRVVEGLRRYDFDAAGHRRHFLRRIVNTLSDLHQSHVDKARKHLTKLLERTDGCALRTGPDPKTRRSKIAADYLVTREAQTQVHSMLHAALDAIDR